MRSVVDNFDDTDGWDGRSGDASAAGLRINCWHKGIKPGFALNGSTFMAAFGAGVDTFAVVVTAFGVTTVCLTVPAAGLALRTGMFIPTITFFGHSCSHLRQLRHLAGSMYARKFSP